MPSKIKQTIKDKTDTSTTNPNNKVTKTAKQNTDKAAAEKTEEALVNKWPPFVFDSSQALKTKMVLNLRAC